MTRWSRPRRTATTPSSSTSGCPDLDGLELGRVLRRFASPPQLVFVSAYDNAAVDAFELRALDYLLKPVGRRRVEEALERVASAVRGHHRHSGSGGPGRRSSVAGQRAHRGGQRARRLDAADPAQLDPVRAVPRRLRPDRHRRRALSAARDARRDRAAMGAASASCACTASTWPTCARPSSSGRSSAERPSSPSATARRSRSPAGTWPSWAAGSES